ncbi:putative K domain, type 1 protein [Helianthus annuus]|nr:putative K domain, type 1 protein [Helianthus annuus]
MLCHYDKIKSVIGKDGNKILQICQESGAEITVEDPVSGCSERVIVIAESGNENGISNEIKKSIDADEEKKENKKRNHKFVEELKVLTKKLPHVLPRDKLPSCAFSSDELVQISGEVNAVRKALQYVSQQLLDHLTSDDDSFTADKSGSFHSFGIQQDAYPPFPHGEPLPARPRDGGSGTFGGRFGPFTDMLTYRLICSDEKVGGVIGFMICPQI